MNLTTIAEHADACQEALCSFLASILTEEALLQVEKPVAATLANISLTQKQRVILIAGTAREAGFAVVLDGGWVPLFARSMMGEPLQQGEPGADDLIREVASQALTTVRTFLSTRGIQIKDSPFSSLRNAEELLGSSLGEQVVRINLRMKVNDDELAGFLLLPMTTADEAPERASEATSASAPSPEPAADLANPPIFAETSAAASASSARAIPVAAPQFPDLGRETISGDGGSESFSMLAEVELEVTVELGRRNISLMEVLRLTMGSVLELDKLVGEPLEVYANGRLIAEGEAVVIDEQFGIRITSLATGKQRAKSFI